MKETVIEAVGALASATSTAELTARVIALEGQRADPRVTDALLGLLEKPRYTAQSMKPMWRSLFAQLAGKHAAPSSVARLQALLDDYRFVFGATSMADWMIGQMTKLTKTLVTRFPDAAAARPTPKSVAPKKPARPTEEDFIRDIAADPDDDGPRQVFCDWLLERGDPRGELFVLQLARHAGKKLTREELQREIELLRENAARWVGPLKLGTSEWEFARGCLDACKLQGKRFDAAIVGHPLWATVHRLAVGARGKASDRTVRDIVLAPVLRKNLRALLDVPGVVLEGVVAPPDGEPWARLETLEGSNYQPDLTARDGGPVHYDPKLWEPLLAGKTLPALRHLSLTPPMNDRAYEAFSTMWTSPLGKRLERVTIRYLRMWDVTRWYADLRPRIEGTKGMKLAELDMWGFVFRGKGGVLRDLEINQCGHFDGLLDALRALPKDAIASLTLRLADPLSAKEKARIERAAKRFPRVKRVVYAEERPTP